MVCHAPSVDVQDDDREFLAAAQEDATLVANLLIRLSRSETYAPRRQLREPASPPASPSTVAEDAIVLSDPPKWGKRRARSRCLMTEGTLSAKREETRRASPTTPLSWSGGSWTSGSVCESTPALPPKRRKQPDAAPGLDVEPALMSPPAKGAKPEPYESRGQGPAAACKWRKMEMACEDREPRSLRVFVAGELAAVGSKSGSGSSKGVVAGTVGEPPKPVAHVEPLRLRLTGEGTTSVVVRRPGKKKTAPELKALKESLLREQVALRKELEEQKKIYEALLEENIKLKNLESRSASHTVGGPTATQTVRGEAESEEPQLPQTLQGRSTAADRPVQLRCTSPSTSEPQRAPLFDLNCPPDDDLF